MITWTDIFKNLYQSDQFDPDFYLRHYPDVSLSGLLPLEHYAKYGVHFGRKPKAICVDTQYGPKSEETRTSNQDAAKDDASPRVTVICTTYNHLNFIKKTLDGFVSQKTTFPFEVLVADDCSPDGTGAVIEEYSKKYPFIKQVTRTKNIGSIPNLMDLARRVRTEYVAICEGDDYWTDPNKLQLQVDFLDDNPEYALCFHPVSVLYEDDPSRMEVFPPEEHVDFSLSQLIQGNFIQTNSVMYRWRYNTGLPEEFAGIHPGDWFMHLVHAEMGRIGYINRNMGVYRKHGGGMWSDAAKNPLALHLKYGAGEIRMFEEMKSHFGGQYDELMSAKQRHVIGEVFEHYIVSGNVSGLADFIKSTAPMERIFLDVCGIAVDEREKLGSASAIERVLRQALRVSVVITSYNHREYLRECIDSVLAQKGAFELEVIIGDDCSTDGSQEIIDDYLKRYPKTVRQVRSSRNVGMLRNMKRCFASSNAPYIAICEGDDYWSSPYKLAKQLAFLCLNHDCSMVFNWIMLYEEWSTRLTPHISQGKIGGDRLKFPDLANEPITANFSACLYRASTVKAVPESYYSHKDAADWLFNLYAAELGDIGFISDLMSVYRLHRGGQWSGLSTKQQQNRVKQVREEFRQVFGNGRGFDDGHVTYSVTEDAPLSNQVLSWLEAPCDGQADTISKGVITIRGWAITAMGGPVEVLIEHHGQVYEYSTNVARNDVVAALKARPGILIASPKCGFVIDLPYEENLKVRFGFRLRGKPFWWRTISLVEDRLEQSTCSSELDLAIT